MWDRRYSCSRIANELSKLYPDYPGELTGPGIAGAVYRLRQAGNQNFPVRAITLRNVLGRVCGYQKVAGVTSRTERLRKDRERSAKKRLAAGQKPRTLKPKPIQATGAWKMSPEELPPSDTKPLHSPTFRPPNTVRSVVDVVSSQCKWPCDTPQGIMFGCYNERAPGSPYCVGHSRIAFRGTARMGY